MVTAAWKSFIEADPSKTYVAYAAYLERKSPWSYLDYLRRANKIQKQLNTTEGIVGFTARLEFFSKKVAQLAVFSDEKTLNDFAHSGQHASCSQQTKETINWMKNTTWNISGSELPLKIEDAINKIQSQK